MRADRSAYAALGLEPGADREGGDSARAAEINRAYRELRAPAAKESLEFERDETFGKRRGAWTALAIAAAVASLALVAATTLMAPRVAGPPLALGKAVAAEHAGEPMEQPIAFPAVDEEIQRAAAMARSEDELALTSVSRDCHATLRREPSLEQLDRCAAFDSAVILLQDRDPLRDRGPFSELAVTSRLMRAGSYLSNDYLAIDSRLDQIRLRTELALAPRVAPEPPPGDGGEIANQS